MDTIIMRFGDSADASAAYRQLKRRYPEAEITRSEDPALRAMGKMQEVMAGEAERLGLEGEEDAMRWFDEARAEIWGEGRP